MPLFKIPLLSHWLTLLKELKYNVNSKYLIYRKSLAFLSLYSIY